MLKTTIAKSQSKADVPHPKSSALESSLRKPEALSSKLTGDGITEVIQNETRLVYSFYIINNLYDSSGVSNFNFKISEWISH